MIRAQFYQPDFISLSFLQFSSREEILEGVTQVILEQLQISCAAECGITDDIIDMEFFACFAESPNQVTYRARLEGTSERDSGSLISLIEDWVGGGASVIVAGVLMSVDTKCWVTISSPDEPECSSGVVGSSSSSESSTVVIIGAVVAVIVVVVALVIIVVIVSLTIIVKRRGKRESTHTLKNDKQ